LGTFYIFNLKFVRLPQQSKSLQVGENESYWFDRGNIEKLVLVKSVEREIMRVVGRNVGEFLSVVLLVLVAALE
jgi:hypothetical protein